MISEPLYSDEFVGRRDELSFLEEEFRAACESGVRFVSIEGEAGIGKSRLLAEFCTPLAAHATLATGSCSEQVRAPYLPFSGILARLDALADLAVHARDHEKYAEEKYAYFTAVAELLRRRSARKPLVIAIEDAQWADSATVELLCFLLERLHAARCLIVVTMRADSLERNPAASMLRSAASRSRASIVQLRAMRRHEIRRLVQQSLKQRAPLEPAILAQIETLAEGNPLFAEELARTALEGGTLTFESHMPLSLQALLGERLLPFTHEERELLYRAALAGQTFDASLVAAISGLATGDVLHVLQRAVRCGLMRQSAESANRFVFRHALIRQALADQLILALAAPLHVRIAEMIEAAPDAGDRAAELAYHWSAARVPEKARFWNEAAARAAWTVFAYRDAIRFYCDALNWEYPAGTQRAAVYERIGTLLYIDGCGDEPAAWYLRSQHEYARAGNAVGAAHARLLEADQMWVDARTHESARAASEAASVLERLGHAPLHAQAMMSVARYSVTLGNVEAAQANLRAAYALCEHFDAGSLASWHEVSGEAKAVWGDRQGALYEFRNAARLAAQSGVSELIAQIENNFALAAFDLGDFELALARHQIAVDEAQRTGMLWRVAYSALNYARTLMFMGRLERARSLVRLALDTSVTTATFKTKAASVGVPLALMLNDRALLTACADERALHLAQQSGEAQRIASAGAAFAALRAAQGSPEEARAIVSAALRSIPRAHRAWDLLIAAALWGSENDWTYARALFAGAPGRPLVRRAYRLFFDAIVCAQTDPARSRRFGRLASVQFGRMGNAFYAAAALEASGARDEALAAYRRMGAVRDVERLRTHASAGDAPMLTQRQLQIAHLVCKGLTNREIAGELHISEHTVEHHVSGIFERLGLHSRTQLAHVMGRSETPK